MNDLHLGIISLICFMLGAFFAGSETALIAANRIRLSYLSEKGNKRARMVLDFAEHPHHFMSCVLVGTNLAIIGCTTTFTAITTRHFGNSGSTLAVAVLVPLFLIFNEILPKSIFLYYPSRAAILSVLPLKVFSILLYPVIRIFSLMTELLMKLSGMRGGEKRFHITVEELQYHLQDSEVAGFITSETMIMISRAMKLKNVNAADIMLPIDKVVMVEEKSSINDYKEVFAGEGFSRIPVYRGDRSNVIGILSIHNLIRAEDPREGKLVLNPPYIIPEDALLIKVLYHMRIHGCHMALISSDEGRLVGMLTLEDILERLVGTITDEFH